MRNRRIFTQKKKRYKNKKNEKGKKREKRIRKRKAGTQAKRACAGREAASQVTSGEGTCGILG